MFFIIAHYLFQVFNSGFVLQSMFRADNGKKAVNTLEYLLKYAVNITDLHCSAALIAQIRNVSVTEFCNKSGYFVFDVIEHLLFLRGMKCMVIKHQNKWLFSQEYMQNNPSVVGIINTVTLNPYVLNGSKWISLDQEETLDDILNAVVVLKMWQPLQKYYEKNLHFYITSDNENLRHEHKNSYAWKKKSVSYDNLPGTVKKELKKHRKSQIMMSSSSEVVLLTPKKKGWTSETVLNYDCREGEGVVHQKIAEEIADVVVSYIQNNDDKGWKQLSHCLYSCLHNLKGELPTDFFPEIMKQIKSTKEQNSELDDI